MLALLSHAAHALWQFHDLIALQLCLSTGLITAWPPSLLSYACLSQHSQGLKVPEIALLQEVHQEDPGYRLVALAVAWTGGSACTCSRSTWYSCEIQIWYPLGWHQCVQSSFSCITTHCSAWARSRSQQQAQL